MVIDSIDKLNDLCAKCPTEDGTPKKFVESVVFNNLYLKNKEIGIINYILTFSNVFFINCTIFSSDARMWAIHVNSFRKISFINCDIKSVELMINSSSNIIPVDTVDISFINTRVEKKTHIFGKFNSLFIINSLFDDIQVASSLFPDEESCTSSGAKPKIFIKGSEVDNLAFCNNIGLFTFYFGENTIEIIDSTVREVTSNVYGSLGFNKLTKKGSTLKSLFSSNVKKFRLGSDMKNCDLSGISFENVEITNNRIYFENCNLEWLNLRGVAPSTWLGTSCIKVRFGGCAGRESILLPTDRKCYYSGDVLIIETR